MDDLESQQYRVKAELHCHCRKLMSSGCTDVNFRLKLPHLSCISVIPKHYLTHFQSFDLVFVALLYLLIYFRIHSHVTEVLR